MARTARTKAPPRTPTGKLFAVTRSRGPAWKSDLKLEQQAGWDEHLAFLQALEAEGFVAAGGSLEDTPYALLAVRAADPTEVRSKLSGDPWEGARLIETTRIVGWDLHLGAGRI